MLNAWPPETVRYCLSDCSTTARAAADLGHRYEGRWIAGGRGRDMRLLIVTISGLAAAFHPAAALFGLGAIATLTNAIVLWRLAASYAVAGGADRLASLEAVIYDLDGTLLDSMPALTAIATALMTERYGIDVEVARRRYLQTTGADFATQLEELFPSHPANGKVAAEFERRKERALRDARPFVEAMPTLSRFRSEGVRQFVCSSSLSPRTRDARGSRKRTSSPISRSVKGHRGHR